MDATVLTRMPGHPDPGLHLSPLPSTRVTDAHSIDTFYTGVQVQGPLCSHSKHFTHQAVSPTTPDCVAQSSPLTDLVFTSLPLLWQALLSFLLTTPPHAKNAGILGNWVPGEHVSANDIMSPFLSALIKLLIIIRTSYRMASPLLKQS